MSINGINGIGAALRPEKILDSGQTPLSGSGGLGPSFTDSLKDAVQSANQKSVTADIEVQKLMIGEGSVHSAMIAMQDSAVAMDMVMAVRNKALEAYQEVMRMPV